MIRIKNENKIAGLALTVRLGERIAINDNIYVQIAGLSNKQANLKIQAPPEIKIDRDFNFNDQIKKQRE